MQTTLSFPAGLSEKYRPRTIARFVGLEKPKKILSAFCHQATPSAWLFVGPPGVGKTSMALALAEQLGAELHHIPSQKCTVENVEETVRRCWYASLFAGGFHLVLVDEADAMSNGAQLALLSKLDATGYPPQTIFIFTCNGTNRLESRFLSRCRVLEFSSYGMREELAGLLLEVWKAETGRDNGVDFLRLAKDCTNNVHDALNETRNRNLGGDRMKTYRGVRNVSGLGLVVWVSELWELYRASKLVGMTVTLAKAEGL